MKKSDVIILIKNSWNDFLRIIKKNPAKTSLLLILPLFLFLFLAPEYNKPIALLTLFLELVPLVGHCVIKTYIKLEASSKSNGNCELKNENEK